MPEPAPIFGDRVRIRATPETVSLGVAECIGIVYGQSIPSASGVGPVVGDHGEDYALNIDFQDGSDGLRYAPGLVDFVDFAAGTELMVGSQRYIRTSTGEWALIAELETLPPTPPPTEQPAERSPADFLGRLLDRIWPDRWVPPGERRRETRAG